MNSWIQTRPLRPPIGHPNAANPGVRESIEAFLTAGSVIPAPEVLRRSQLAGYAFMRLPPEHLARAALRPDYTAALYDHLKTRVILRSLLLAWQEEGILALLFKGFQLSEFVYSTPGQRPYGDVDLQIPAMQTALASATAARLGWTESWNRERSMTPFHHELMTLISPDGSVHIDVHERLVHNLLPHVERQRQISKAVWERAREHDWDGLRVLLPTPEDCVLIGLVLNRCWGDDSWRIRVHDLPDFRAVLERFELDLLALRARARELGCSRTLELFLRLCNPLQNRLRLQPRSRWEYLAWGLQILPERGLLPLEHSLSKGWVLATKVQDVLREGPNVVRVLLALQQHESLTHLTTRMLPAVRFPAPRLQAFDIQRVIRGVQFALNLLRARPDADCLPRSLAITASLRRRGVPAVFRSGVRREGSRLLSHAWVEIGGRPLFDALEPQTAHLYTPNFTAPEPPAPEVRSVQV